MEGNVGRPGSFRWRGHEVSRIEGLSDAVFAFAITLLVVSLEVPKTFNELAETMHGFGAFLISFMLLFAVWFNQYKFFRRYGLRDTITCRAKCRAVVRSALLCIPAEVFVHASWLIDLPVAHGESAAAKWKRRAHDREQ